MPIPELHGSQEEEEQCVPACTLWEQRRKAAVYRAGVRLIFPGWQHCCTYVVLFLCTRPCQCEGKDLLKSCGGSGIGEQRVSTEAAHLPARRNAEAAVAGYPVGLGGICRFPCCSEQDRGKLGRLPPIMHHQPAPSDGQAPGGRFQRSHLAGAFAKTKGSGGGTGGGSGRGLMGQIIPIYGFGIFLYILYILFKLSKGKTAEDRKCSTATPGNTHRKITNFELAQLQEKLRETEKAMEKLINRVGPNGERAQTVTSDQEKRLLHQLREITRVMKEGKFIDSSTPEKEAEEAPYMEDWEGYPEETYPIYDLSDCIKHRQETILVDYPDPKEPSAEEIAERVGVLEEESDHLGWERLPLDSRVQEDNSFTSCYPKPETCSCCFHEDDPVVLAENAGFSADSYSDEQEESTKEYRSRDFSDEGLGMSPDKTCIGGMLRKRNPQGLE
ncbi:protein RIC-3 [Fukomys damarensis]|nr:protein RIC-3 [Fukomys damarensis]